jgi:hypothetical protein
LNLLSTYHTIASFSFLLIQPAFGNTLLLLSFSIILLCLFMLAIHHIFLVFHVHFLDIAPLLIFFVFSLWLFVIFSSVSYDQQHQLLIFVILLLHLVRHWLSSRMAIVPNPANEDLNVEKMNESDFQNFCRI